MTANAYFIPAGADFDPYAPTLQDLGRAINISKAMTHMDFTSHTHPRSTT